MKTKFCLTLTLFTFIALSFVPNIFAQDTSPTYTVRTVYIVPNDREPDPDMDTKTPQDDERNATVLRESDGISRIW